VAGGLDPGLAIGDIVVADFVIQHDAGVLEDQRIRTYQPGYAPVINPTERLGYRADPALLDRVRQRLAGITVPGQIVYGTVLSGDQYLNCEATRERLRSVYASSLPADVKRQRKQAEIEALRSEYRRLRDTEWHGNGGYDEWIDTPINNAKLLPFGLYHRSVPAFAALFEQQQRDWPAFYAAVARLAKLAPGARAAAIDALQRHQPP